jgi:hypothetical protein
MAARNDHSTAGLTAWGMTMLPFAHRYGVERSDRAAERARCELKDDRWQPHGDTQARVAKRERRIREIRDDKSNKRER